MTSLAQAVDEVRREQRRAGKPLAVILAGHNGSGKSTMWLRHLSPSFRIPLVNADRMMLSILPEADHEGRLIKWAQALRDTDESWMKVAQKGVEAFVAQAMARGVPFAMETVFSYWEALPNGKFASKIDLIREMQAAGYFVLLFFVGLSNVRLSIGRVMTRVAEGGPQRRRRQARRAVSAHAAGDRRRRLGGRRDRLHRQQPRQAAGLHGVSDPDRRARGFRHSQWRATPDPQ